MGTRLSRQQFAVLALVVLIFAYLALSGRTLERTSELALARPLSCTPCDRSADEKPGKPAIAEQARSSVDLVPLGAAAPSLWDRIGAGRRLNRVAVVMPFPEKQLEYLLVNINSWHKYFTPCASADLAPYVDLVLYMSRDDGMLPGVRAKVDFELSKSSARKCFGHVRYAVAGLKAERDRYGPAAPDQFYKMWDGAFLGLNDDTTIAPYDYIFYMEPDTRPIRKLWLDKVVMEVQDASPFWAKGSIGRYGTGERPHLNGNSIYRWNDQTFAQYVTASYGAFTQYASFDQSLYTYMEQNKKYELYHLFHFSDFMQNRAHLAMPPLDAFVAENPNTYLVHGKGVVRMLTQDFPTDYDGSQVREAKDAQHNQKWE